MRDTNKQQTASLIGNFPRMMGNPRQNYIAYNKEQRDAYIQKYIKYLDLYISVYAFSEVGEDGFAERNSAIIDKRCFLPNTAYSFP